MDLNIDASLNIKNEVCSVEKGFKTRFRSSNEVLEMTFGPST
jgi:hypothetical protein